MKNRIALIPAFLAAFSANSLAAGRHTTLDDLAGAAGVAAESVVPVAPSPQAMDESGSLSAGQPSSPSSVAPLNPDFLRYRQAPPSRGEKSAGGPEHYFGTVPSPGYGDTQLNSLV